MSKTESHFAGPKMGKKFLQQQLIRHKDKNLMGQTEHSAIAPNLEDQQFNAIYAQNNNILITMEI